MHSKRVRKVEETEKESDTVQGDRNAECGSLKMHWYQAYVYLRLLYVHQILQGLLRAPFLQHNSYQSLPHEDGVHKQCLRKTGESAVPLP
jgi:hypothetical protein